MTTHDPIDLLRDELGTTPLPSPDAVDLQRGRLEATLRRQAAPARRRRARRWLPASAIAVSAAACATFVAFALLPSSGRHDDGGASHRGLRLVTAPAGGAFRGLDVDTASAAELLHAAGRTAAAGLPDPGPNDWTYTRMVSGTGDFPMTTSEKWTSPDGERSFSVDTVRITKPEQGPVGRMHSVHYEYLRKQIIGDVQWIPQADGSLERRANWSADAHDSSGDLARTVKLNQLIRASHDVDDISEALDESVAGAKLTFRDGHACETTPKFSTCGGSGFVPQGRGLTPEESKRLYLTGQLLTVTLGNVYSKDTTRAIYDYLAALPEAVTAPAKDGSGDVVLSLRVKGPSYTTRRMPNNGNGIGYEIKPIPGTTFNTKAVAMIDPTSGRIVQLSPGSSPVDLTARYTDFGVAPGPGDGSTICRDFAEACVELDDLSKRLEANPEAKFRGVVDWMFIAQFCDGLLNRDGTVNPDGGAPLSSYRDPKAIAKRKACEQREAAKARAH